MGFQFKPNCQLS